MTTSSLDAGARRGQGTALVAWTALMALCGCGGGSSDQTVSFAPPATLAVPTVVQPQLSIVSGDLQVGPVGSTLPQRLRVRLTDSGARPIAGASVAFRVAAGTGTLAGADALTNADGQAEAGPWTLGSLVGLQQVTATYDSRQVSFVATATPTGASAPIAGGTGKIVFASWQDGQIYTINPDGSGRTRLTNEGRNSWPRWSPDGTGIAFARRNGDPGPPAPNDIYIMSADGSNVVRRTVGAGFGSVSWSPDGSRLAVSTQGLYDSSVYVIRTIDDGSAPVRVSAVGRSPAWSPDGRKIAFVQISGDDGYDAIATVNPDGSGVTTITAPNDEFVLGGWSPDGSRLVATKCYRGACECYSMSLAGSNVTQLTTIGNASAASYSSDGTRIVIVLRTGSATSGFSIGIIASSGSDVLALTGDALNPDWR